MASLIEVKQYCLAKFDEIEHELALFKDQVRIWFETHPKLSKCKPPVIHSVKHRLKDTTHLTEKVHRKLIPDPESHQIEIEEGWNPEDIFKSLTDLAGVRVLLLHQKQFEPVHLELMKKVESGDWHFYEPPKAYTWDPDSANYFVTLGIETKIKESHYTSVHYVIRPRRESLIACEIQVRTLFEEIWGEVDHTLNYPSPTDSISCKEQLRVLAKVVGAGSRLVDSIFNSAAVDAKPKAEAVVTNPAAQPAVVVTEAPAPAPAPTVGIAIDGEERQEAIPPTEKPEPVLIEDGVEERPEVANQAGS